MKIALIFVHNREDIENVNQIDAIKNLVVEVVDGPFVNTETGDTWTTIHHEIKEVGVPHEVKIYQVVPFGVTPPTNRYEINSGGIVQYGKGDEDKRDNHPRFFNWGLKRGTDYGAEIVIYVEDYKKLDFKKLLPKLQKLEDVTDTTEFVDDLSCKITTLKLLKEIGQLDETKTKTQAISDLKQKVLDKGWKNG